MVVIISARGLGRYRLENQSNQFVLNFLNMKSLAYHLEKVMKMNAEKRADVYEALTTHGKVSMQYGKAS